MPDPVITPLAAFGLVTTILSYLINTAQNLHGKYHEIKDYPEVLGRYGLIVHDCLQSYDLWLRLWHRPNEQSYNELFGVNGWIAIKTCRQDVERLIVQTADILCLRVPVRQSKDETSVASTHVSTLQRAILSIKSAAKSPVRLVRRWKTAQGENDLAQMPIELEPGDPLKWQIFTGALEGFLTTYKPEELVLKRIIGVLGPNQNLKNKMVDLEKAVGSLAKRTSNAFQLMGHGKEPKEPADVDASRMTIEFRAVARNVMDEIRQRGTSSRDGGGRGAWFLELEFPTSAKDVSVAMEKIIRECSISFIARTALLPDKSTMTREIKMQRLRGHLETEDDDVSALAFAMAEFHTKSSWTVSMPGQAASPPVYQLDWANPPPDVLMKDWRTLLDACAGDQAVRKALELERAHFALGLTLWFILLWETEWFGHVCSCAFRCVLFAPVVAGAVEEATHDGGLRDEVRCRREHVYSCDASRLDHAPKFHSKQPTIPEVTAEVEAIAEAAYQQQGSAVTPPAATAPAVTSPASCRGRAGLQYRLYHLGMLLAELALATPIHLSSDVGQVPRADFPGRPVGQFRRIREIRNHREIPAQLKDAIGFCFEKATETCWSVETPGMAAYRVSEFLERVVKPVKEYYDVVEKNFKYSRQFAEVAQRYQEDRVGKVQDSPT